MLPRRVSSSSTSTRSIASPATHPACNFTRHWADRERLLVEVEAIVRQGIADGDFRATDSELAALTILANDEAVQNWYRPSTGQTAARLLPEQIGSYVADLAFLRGLLVDEDVLDSVRTHRLRRPDVDRARARNWRQQCVLVGLFRMTFD